MCYGMKCPYELPDGKCSISWIAKDLYDEMPDDAECMQIHEERNEEDERIREITESKS